MTTAAELVNDAFDDIEVKSAEEDLTTNEMAIGIRRLNRLATAFAASGLNFGYSKVTDETDELTIPDWSEDLFVTFLAIRLAPGFGVIPSDELKAAASENLEIADRYLINMPEVQYPGILPVGTGNNRHDSYNANFFFDDTEDDLTTNGRTDLTDDTSVTLSTE